MAESQHNKPVIGRVLEGYGSSYSVLYRGVLYSCSLRGRLRQVLHETHNPIAVGDRVRFSRIGGEEGVIEELLGRRNRISRPTKWGTIKERVIVSNVDQIVVVVSVKSPVLKTGLIDRMLLVAEREQLRGIICINKCDLSPPGGLDEVAGLYRRLRYGVHIVSAQTGEGVAEFQRVLTGKFSVLLGQSGVGKSSLLNRLQPGLGLKVREISAYSNKGKHTTSYVSAVHCDFGAMIADTPGFRDFGLWGIRQEEVESLFREFRRYAGECKFNPCSHLHEPSCAVRSALGRGRIAASRYDNYRRIYESFSEERY